MKKSKTIFGVDTNDVVEQIKIDSTKTSKFDTVETPKQKTKSLLKRTKVMGHNKKRK